MPINNEWFTGAASPASGLRAIGQYLFLYGCFLNLDYSGFQNFIHDINILTIAFFNPHSALLDKPPGFQRSLLRIIMHLAFFFNRNH